MNVESISVDIPSTTGLSSTEVAKVYAQAFELERPDEHYVYCFSYEYNGKKCWYVGETSKLKDRISAHARKKKIDNIEVMETVADREEGLERERELSYEMAIKKNTTNIYGGR